jgi:hypothetical protein
MARPSIYSKEITDEVCVRLAGGEGLRKICSADHLPVLSTILLWVVNGDHPEFSEQYRIARQANGEAHGDRVAELAEKVINGDLDPNAARVAIAAIEWSAERMASKSYAPNSKLSVDGEVKYAFAMNYGQPKTD